MQLDRQSTRLPPSFTPFTRDDEEVMMRVMHSLGLHAQTHDRS